MLTPKRAETLLRWLLIANGVMTLLVLPALLTATGLLAAVSHGQKPQLVARPAPDRLEGVRSVMVLRRDEPLYTEPSQNAARRGAAERGARLPVFELARGGGCSGRWFSVGPLAWICEDGAEASGASAPPEQPRAPSGDGLPFDYYFVNPDGSFTNVLTDPFPATTGPASSGGGNSEFEADVVLPSTCIAPIVFVTSATGSWFASTGF